MRVTVDDNGPGPARPAIPERLFDKFQRGIQEGTIVGVGLGLSICRAIVQAHGGTIAAGARPGGGARTRAHVADAGARARDGRDASDPRRRGRRRHPQRAARAARRPRTTASSRRRPRSARRDRSAVAQARSAARRSRLARRRRARRHRARARMVAGADRRAVGAHARGARRSRRSMPAPTTTSRSRSAPPSCSRACAPACAATCAAPSASRLCASAIPTSISSSRHARRAGRRRSSDAARVPRARVPRAPQRQDRAAGAAAARSRGGPTSRAIRGRCASA